MSVVRGKAEAAFPGIDASVPRIVTARNIGADQAPPGLAGDHVSIAVRDTGSGIPTDIVDRVFEPFFTTKDVGEGTGLGMSIAYNTVAKHHGRILVDSKVGQGTTFTLLLPIEQNIL